ncbi:hypothetical protein NYR70_10400 [Actinobacillus equuli subsp. equuli]|uniref:hypothetical protein n=1 Tax=Actinobacillus equuli TaxID=718 RepID=UPI0024185338|nr:hypothetical protein [Actinobacillus equuli]MDG4953526.1 hypothetical protein [Actinobacillus equuli subsp. equuli]WGE48655.1 hypothetical protein NYR67_10390 [Actinobacillus equuli subsp. equuli]WGE55025.1 hypothetical protein NYR70_10400 [Actinobacillus equuli subsp. equuli]WGE81336.1 hypothetical protein NYR66_10485 [Actinobacillus equuli subsp. haemolyticus]WGE83451.1 hypothetical protein NYR86_10610 [Actinobacillus equuli subsp. equuli]
MNKEEMQLVLQDVRKAYRLLADYQQRIIELLDFIKNELKAEHYSHYQPNSVTSQSIHKIYNEPDIGRKFLPMLNMKLLWHKTTNVPAGEWWGDHIQQNDLVFDFGIVSDESNGKTLSPEESKSELHIYVYKCVKYTRKNNWYNDVWEKYKYPDFGEVKTLSNNKDIEYLVYGDKLDLSDLYNEEAVRKELSEFRKRASEKLGQEI